MSDEKHTTSHHDIEQGIARTMTTVTLTPEQFEALYLQPKMAAAHVPLAMDLLGFQAADGNSGVATLGAFYGCAAIGLYLSAIFEWSVGNTFPMVVFGSFGGFWSSYAILIQPTLGVAASFAPANVTDSTFVGVTASAAGAATRQYNSGVGLYFTTWTLLCALYAIASLRTNVAFTLVFFPLTVAFGLIAAAHFHTGIGELTRAANEFKAAGAFAFITGLAGFWIDISLILKAVDFPIEIPVFDLSGLKCMQPRRMQQFSNKERME
ncbi:hypothetical protein Clacol_007486 [Clathrus columnatus]|uniref:Uncharacterized protein n=1 Tax=Clathrus columnatus TaxID=1419009 RepID=A0AAV5AK36_9AGAM|nr:hypothetical protein Clacol_007486 [Clathrus columnatus]